MSEQKQVTAQDILVSIGARFNAEMVRLGDNIHNAIVERDNRIAQLENDNADLMARIEAKGSPDEDAK